MEKNKKNLIINICLTLIYAIFTLIIVLHHEIWADEAQVWQLCKYLSVPELFKHLVNEGHPAFFYLLVMPFAKILHGVEAILSMQFICWISMVFSVFLLLEYSPFNRFTKFAITVSSGFLYFLPVIARSYSILPFMVFLAAILYPKSKEKPLIYAALLFLIANTHIIMFGFVLALGCLFFYDNVVKEKKNYPACGIIFLGLLAVFLQLHGTTSSNAFIQLDVKYLIDSANKVLWQFFVNSYDNNFPDTNRFFIPFIDFPAILISIGLYISLFIALAFKNLRLFAVAVIGIGFQLFVYIIGYNHWVFVTRIFCAHIIMIFCLWTIFTSPNLQEKLSQNYKKLVNIALSIFFILTFFNGLKYSVLEVKYPYSGAKETSEFITKNIDLKNSVLITDNVPHSMALAYYLDEKTEIYSAAKIKPFKYVFWDESLTHFLSDKGWGDYMRVVKNEFPKNKKLYAVIPTFFMKNRPEELNENDFRLIFKSNPSIVRFEGFKVYEFKY